MLGFLFFPLLAQAADRPVHIVLVGDSTVTDRSGWGAGFRQFVNEGATVTNTAQGGRSSKSFRAEGHWDKALALKGDYYVIQFGHNDQPGKGPERETVPATTYYENMARYVDEVRAQGGQPILVTSLTRRIFSKTNVVRIESTLTPYAEAVKRLAAARSVPLIDLHALSIAYCEKIGPERTAAFNFPDQAGKNDTTHLEGEGSVTFVRLVVDDLRKVVPALAPVLRAEPLSPLTLWYRQPGRPSGGGPAATMAPAGRWAGKSIYGRASTTVTTRTGYRVARRETCQRAHPLRVRPCRDLAPC